MSHTFYKDVILDTLKSKTVVGTDSNGKLIDGATAADLRYLKLDQTSAQTVTASPIFNWGTSTRIPYYSVTKTLTDSANLTFDGNNLTAVGFTIGANTLTTTEWAFLDGQDQAVKTTSSPEFAALNINGTQLNLAEATGGVSSYTVGGGSWYLIGEMTVNVRVYTYKVINGVKTYSDQYLQLPQVVVDMGDDDNFGHFDYSWTGATGSPDGYRLLRSADGGDYDSYADTTATSFADTGATLWTASPITTPSFYFSNTITLNGVISNIYSGINFWGEQTFNQGINIIGALKFNSVEAIRITDVGDNVVIGLNAGVVMTSASETVLVGESAGLALTTGGSNVLVGSGAGSGLTTGVNNTLIGASAGFGLTVGDSSNTIIGAASNAYDSNNIILGASSTVTSGVSNCLLLGNNVSVSTASHVVIGSGQNPYTDLYFGKGVVASTPGNFLIHATGGTGSNNDGGHLFLVAGKGTGTGTPGGLYFQASDPIGSGSTLQTPSTRLSILNTGATWSVSQLVQGHKINFYDTSIGAYSQADSYLDLFADGAVRIGNSSAGAPTTYLSIEADGDTFWTGDGTGLPYGSCYGDHIAWSQVNPVQNTWYDISDTDMNDGELNLVTHDGSGQLTVTKGGRYLINYQMTMEASVANKHIESAISVSGTENAAGKAHEETKAVSAEFNLSSTAILDLAANATINLSVRTTDAGAVTLTVDDINITLVQVGGT